MVIGGFMPTVLRNTCLLNLGVLYKCSGHNPTPGAQQKPEDWQYAMDRSGERIPVVEFPVNHKDFWLGAKGIASAVKKMLARGANSSLL